MTVTGISLPTRRAFVAAITIVASVIFGLAGLSGCMLNSLPSRDAPTFTPAPPPPEGFATLYIFRGYMEAGLGVWPVTFLNDVKVADVKSVSYTYVYLRPGKYHLRTERSQVLTAMGNLPFDFTIDGTGTYYLQFGTPGRSSTFLAGKSFVTLNSGDWDWHLMPENEAMATLPKTRYLPPYTQLVGQF